MRGVAFYPARNLALRKDADEFRREALTFASLHGLSTRAFSNEKPNRMRREEVARVLASAKEPLDCVAFFCHGWQRGIQAGHTLATVKELARQIADVSTTKVVVPLYACSAASGGAGGDGGFADRLRDELCRVGATGCRVLGHTTAGHCTKNPFARIFEGPVPAAGGQWITAPSPPFYAPFKAAMHAEDNTLRYLLPFLSPEELHEALRAS